MGVGMFIIKTMPLPFLFAYPGNLRYPLRDRLHYLGNIYHFLGNKSSYQGNNVS